MSDGEQDTYGSAPRPAWLEHPWHEDRRGVATDGGSMDVASREADLPGSMDVASREADLSAFVRAIPDADRVADAAADRLPRLERPGAGFRADLAPLLDQQPGKVRRVRASAGVA